MNELTLKDAIKELEELSTGDWVPYEYTPEEAKLILNHINNLQSKIDKAIKYIEEDILNNKIEKVDWNFDDCYYSDMPAERIKPLIDILKENNNED